MWAGYGDRQVKPPNIGKRSFMQTRTHLKGFFADEVIMYSILFLGADWWFF